MSKITLNKFELSYINTSEFKNMSLTLDRIDNALKAINFDALSLGKVIHIAGTNGKGTTSYFISQMLQIHGYKTALFTSPHILNINERLSYCLNNISDDEFDKLYDTYGKIIHEHSLSYFEGIFFIALVWFSKLKPDVTILETGLGGTFDATNTSLINDKICIMTAISQDHTNLLGENIYSITSEKLGIIRNKNAVFVGVNEPSVIDYINKNIENTTQVRKSDFASNNYPYPYSDNYDTAKTVANYIANTTINDIPNLKLLPCRQERIKDNIILDGSHNASGILSLIKSNISNNPSVLVSFTKERNIAKLLKLLSSYSNNIVVTTIPDNDRSITSDDLDGLPYSFNASPLDALHSIYDNKRDILVIGSFYLCAYVKQNIDRLAL